MTTTDFEKTMFYCDHESSGCWLKARLVDRRYGEKWLYDRFKSVSSTKMDKQRPSSLHSSWSLAYRRKSRSL